MAQPLDAGRPPQRRRRRTFAARTLAAIPFAALVAIALLTASAPPAEAQLLRGRVLDGSTGFPLPLSSVWLLDADRDQIELAMADSLGRYFLTVPDSGRYFLVAERFGFFETETPLLEIAASRDYDLDLELRPEPIRMEGLEVTVRNEQVNRWIRAELGLMEDPAGLFGYRVLQGERLMEAKTRAKFDPTHTMRWLYIPVQHGRCVSINVYLRAESVSWLRGPRTSAFGGELSGTTSLSEIGARMDDDPDECNAGTLWLNDRRVPNEHIDRIDMATIGVVVTLPNMVRMYTYDFNWAFR